MIYAQKNAVYSDNPRPSEFPVTQPLQATEKKYGLRQLFHYVTHNPGVPREKFAPLLLYALHVRSSANCVHIYYMDCIPDPAKPSD